MSSSSSDEDAKKSKKKRKPRRKKIVYYEYTKDYKQKIQNYDLAFFRGEDFVSDFISYLEKNYYAKNKSPTKKLWRGLRPGDFTHVGILLRGSFLIEKLQLYDSYAASKMTEPIDPDEIYVLESTMSGRLGDGAKNIFNESFFGVQIRDFSKVVCCYLASASASASASGGASAKIAVAFLSKKYRERISLEHELDFCGFVRSVLGTRYDYNAVSLMSVPFKRLRYCRPLFEKLCATEDWLFCSELVAHCYCRLGILVQREYDNQNKCKEEGVEPKNCFPEDFLGYRVPRDDKHIPDDLFVHHRHGGSDAVEIKLPCFIQ